MSRKPRPPTNPRVRTKLKKLHGTVTWMIHYPPDEQGDGETTNVYDVKEVNQVTDYLHMIDYVGNKTAWNPCWHESIKGSGGVLYDCFWKDVVDGQGQPVTPAPLHVYAQAGQPAYADIQPSDLIALEPVLKESVMKGLSKGTLKKAVKQMPEVVSIGNFLLELREGIRGIIPRFSNFKDLLGNLYLGYKFGAESFCRDLASLTSVWTKVMRRMKYLRKHNGQDVWVRGYRDKARNDSGLTSADYDVPSDVIIEQNTVPSHVVVKLHVVPESITGTVHVNILTHFLMTGLDTFWGKVDMMGAALGLNNPAKIAWNNYRMTWLVEYFVNVQPYLNKLAADPLRNGTIDIRSCWVSQKVTYLVEVYSGRRGTASLQHPSIDLVYEDMPIGQYTVTTYRRLPGLDLTEDELVSCDLTDSQKLILVALAESRLSWGNTKWTKWAIRKWGPWDGGSKPRLAFKTPPGAFRRKFVRRVRT